jgi:membrane protein implicated in regulation of membrane protease activity
VVLLFVGAAIGWVLNVLWLILLHIWPFLVIAALVCAAVWAYLRVTEEYREQQRRLRQDRRSYLSAQAGLHRLYKDKRQRFYR